MEKYLKGRLLGKGSYGAAFFATVKADKSSVVLKEISLYGMSKRETETALQEGKLLLALRHPNVVACKEAFQQENTLYIVLEYCSEGDLSTALRAQKAYLAESIILDWFVQLCLGLKHIHDRRIVHRDLKPQNIFMSAGGILKIGDFGVSRILSATNAFANTMLGTPYYLSPEICSNKAYNQKSDIWSLGCILYEIMTLKKPFIAASSAALSLKIRAGQYVSPPGHYSKELRALVASMLQTTASKRPSVNAILQTPTCRSRIDRFLSETMRSVEFSREEAAKKGASGGAVEKLEPKASPHKPAPDPQGNGSPKSGGKVGSAAQKMPVQQKEGEGEAAKRDLLEARARAAREGQAEIARLRLQEQQRALEEEHQRMQKAHLEAQNAKLRTEAQAAADSAAIIEAAKRQAAKKHADQELAREAAEKEQKNRRLRERSRLAIKQQKAEWAARNKEAWTNGHHKGLEEPVVLAPSSKAGGIGHAAVPVIASGFAVNVERERRNPEGQSRAIPSSPSRSPEAALQKASQGSTSSPRKASAIQPKAVDRSDRGKTKEEAPLQLRNDVKPKMTGDPHGEARLQLWRENREAAARNKQAYLQHAGRQTADDMPMSVRPDLPADAKCRRVSSPGLMQPGQVYGRRSPRAAQKFKDEGLHLGAIEEHREQFQPEVLPDLLQVLHRCDSYSSAGSRDYTLMLQDMASLTRGQPAEGLTDPFGYGFSDSGIYTLIDGREIDVGVDWDEPLDVRARAVRRVLRRRLGPAMFERAWHELVTLQDHSNAASIDAAQSIAANNFVDFLEPEDVAFVPLMQQLLAAEECLRLKPGNKAALQGNKEHVS